MAYTKRKVKRGKFQIDGKTIIITSFSEHLVDAVWIQRWYSSVNDSFTIDKNKDGKLDDKERAEARKAMSARLKRPEGKSKKDSRRGNKKRERSSRRTKK